MSSNPLAPQRAPAPLRLATLGPSGTNHELISKRYLTEQGVEHYEIVLVPAFTHAVSMLKSGAVDFILQCAVHPETSQTLGENFKTIFAIDCFISNSQELAVLTRREVALPRTIGVLLPANEKYTDLSKWEKAISYNALPLIKDALLAGEIDSGLTYRTYANQHADQLRVDEIIGSPDDVWIIYGRHRAFNGRLVGLGSGAFLEQVKQLTLGATLEA